MEEPVKVEENETIVAEVEEVVPPPPSDPQPTPPPPPPPQSKKKKKRHHRKHRISTELDGLSASAMHRIKKQTNNIRLSADAIKATRGITHEFLKTILKDSVASARQNRRKTIRIEDVEEAFAARRQIIQ
jgi:histone H3/H4